MSVTLRYSGTLKDPALLPRLREEFQDIAAINGWPVDVLERTPPPKGRGGRLLAPPLTVAGLKVVVHPQTDPLWLTFDEQGALTRQDPYPLGQRMSDGGGQRYGFLQQAQASMQTGIGGAQLHRTVVGLLDYLKRAYLPDLQVSDDSGYWEGRDDAALERLMDRR